MFFSSYRAGRSGEIFAWKLDLEGTNSSFCDFGCAHTLPGNPPRAVHNIQGPVCAPHGGFSPFPPSYPSIPRAQHCPSSPPAAGNEGNLPGHSSSPVCWPAPFILFYFIFFFTLLLLGLLFCDPFKIIDLPPSPQ